VRDDAEVGWLSATCCASPTPVHQRAPRRRLRWVIGRRRLRHPALPGLPRRGVRLSTAHVNNVLIAEFVVRG
jgi:hypothetical protein